MPPRHNLVLPASGAKPVGGLTDRRFRYVDSDHTDIRKTFRRVRAQLRQAERQQHHQPEAARHEA